MSTDSENIDFSNLQDKKDEIEEKANRFSNFSSFVIGLLLGAIISAPVQLMFRPLTYEGDILRYGPSVLLDPAPVWIIPLASILLLIITIFIIIGGYIITLGLVGRETVTLPYNCEDTDDFFIDVRDHLRKEGYYLNVEVSAKNQQIKCEDPNRVPSTGLIVAPFPPGVDIIAKFMIDNIFPKTIVGLHFDPNLSILSLTYDPNSEDAQILVRKLEEKFGDD